MIESVMLSCEPCVYPPRHEASVFPLSILFCFLRDLGIMSRRRVKAHHLYLPDCIARRCNVRLHGVWRCLFFFFFFLVGKTRRGFLFRGVSILTSIHLCSSAGGAKTSTTCPPVSHLRRWFFLFFSSSAPPPNLGPFPPSLQIFRCGIAARS